MSKKLDHSLKIRINHLYFKDNKNSKTIADELNLKPATVMRAIDRSKFYDYQPGSIENSKEEVEIIQNEVCKNYNISVSTIQRKSRFPEVLIPRQMAHTLCYNLTKCSYSFIV